VFQILEWCLGLWYPSEKAVCPDYFAKTEYWKNPQKESWQQEVKQLQEKTGSDGLKNEALDRHSGVCL
jgi:NADH dehydrogenase (ubiquinone) 1 beta subcomplex subunit 9